MSIWRNLEESASTEMLFGRPPDHRCTFEAVQRNRPIRGTRSIGPGNYHLITIFSVIYILEQITVSCTIQLYGKSGKPKIGCTDWGLVINLQVQQEWISLKTKVHLMETHLWCFHSHLEETNFTNQSASFNTSSILKVSVTLSITTENNLIAHFIKTINYVYTASTYNWHVCWRVWILKC